MPRAACCLALLLLAAVSSAAPAQEAAPPPTPVDSAAYVRVQQRFAVPRRVTGALVAADAQSVTVLSARSGMVTTPLAELAWMDVSMGRLSRGEGARRGARNGLIGGLAVGVVLVGLGAASDAGEGCGDCFLSATTGAVLLSLPLTALTTVGGALLGAAAPGDRWIRVRVPVVLRQPSY